MTARYARPAHEALVKVAQAPSGDCRCKPARAVLVKVRDADCASDKLTIRAK